jgi:hypothetical protein
VAGSTRGGLDYNDLGAIILAQDWWQEAISERPTPWEVKRIEAVADYSGCSKRDRYYSDLAVRIVLHDWKALVSEILVSWMKDKHHGIAVSLIVHCEAALAAPEPTAPAIQAPEPSQVVNANLVTLVVPLRGRISATNRQFQEVPLMVAQQAATGDRSFRLRFRWVCNEMACPNYMRNCFIISDTDPLTNNFPITPEVLTAWCADIRAGNSEIERPSVATLFRMRTNRELKEVRREREGHRPGAKEGNNPAFQ